MPDRWLIGVQNTQNTGMTVRYESELVEIDRKRLVFQVRAYDGCGHIGEGTHERFIISVGKFM